jgi:hypothetical protein
MSKDSGIKSEFSFKMITKSGRSRQVMLSMELKDNIKTGLEKLAKKNKISSSLQGRWIIMLKHNNWESFAFAAQENCRSMNMEAKKIITDYFSTVDGSK